MLKLFMRPLLRAITRVLYRVKLRNPHGTRFDADRLLIVANHESFLDGLLLGLYLPINPVFVVNTQIAQVPLFRLVLSMVDYLTVDPASPMAIKQIVRLVESGRPVVIFPEGRLTITGSLMKVYEGPAFVAAKTGATIIPVRLDGPARTHFSRTSGEAPHGWFPKMHITIQPPTLIDMPATGSAKEKRRKAGDALRRIMQDMIFASRPRTTIFRSLLEASRNFGRKRLMVEDIKQIEYSYAELIKMTLVLGRTATRVSDTEPGERIGLLLPNLAPTICLLIGLGTFRRAPAMLNYTAGTEGMQNACIAANIKVVITSRAFLEQSKLTDKVAALQNVRVIYLEDLREQISLGDKLWWALYARWLPQFAGEHGAEPEDTAVVLFTSGSEGKPKGVVLSHRAILANISQIRAIVDFNATGDKLMSALPVFHSFGLTAGALLPLMTGTRIFLYPSPLHYRVIPEIIYDRGCTILFGTSTFLGQYGKFANPFDFYRLRYVIAGAEKLSQQVRDQWFEKFGIRIFEGYGATETAPVLACNCPTAYRSGTVGQLLPGIQAKLIPVPGIDKGGVLHVNGPNVMSGYYRFDRPGVIEAPKSEAGDGWYDTGDVVEIDDDGFVRIQGRVKRFAKIAGEMVSLEVVEKIAVAASPDKLHAASSQVDPSRGEALVLFTTDASLGREQLQNAARESGLPELAVPKKIVVLDEMPLLGTGKTDYMTLKQMAEKA